MLFHCWLPNFIFNLLADFLVSNNFILLRDKNLEIIAVGNRHNFDGNVPKFSLQLVFKINRIDFFVDFCNHKRKITYLNHPFIKTFCKYLQQNFDQNWKKDSKRNIANVDIQVLVRKSRLKIDTFKNEILICDWNPVNSIFCHDWNFFIKSTLQNRWALKYKGIILSVLVWVEFNILVILGWRKNSASDHVSTSKN